MPAVGFGFGDAVIYEMLLSKGLLPDTSKPSIDVLVYAMDEKLRKEAAKVSSLLRAEGLKVDFLLEDKKAKWVFQRADKIGTNIAILIAPLISDVYCYRRSCCFDVRRKRIERGQGCREILEGIFTSHCRYGRCCQDYQRYTGEERLDNDLVH